MGLASTHPPPYATACTTRIGQALKREHETLKREVAALEQQVASLQAVHDKLKAQVQSVGGVDL